MDTKRQIIWLVSDGFGLSSSIWTRVMNSAVRSNGDGFLGDYSAGNYRGAFFWFTKENLKAVERRINLAVALFFERASILLTHHQQSPVGYYALRQVGEHIAVLSQFAESLSPPCGSSTGKPTSVPSARSLITCRGLGRSRRRHLTCDLSLTRPDRDAERLVTY